MNSRRLLKHAAYCGRQSYVRALALPRGWRWARQRLHLPANTIFDPLTMPDAAGVRIHPLDAGDRFERPLPALPHDPEAAEFFLARQFDEAGPSYVAELVDGRAWGHPSAGVFTADDRFAPAFTRDPWGAALHSVWTRVSLPPPRHLAGRVLYLVTPEAADNYHHWMIDLLPRLGLVQRAGFKLADFQHVIVNHSARRYQFETLAHLGIPREKIIRAEASLHARADLLVVPSLKPHTHCLPAADLAFLRSAFLGDAPVRGHRRLFLTRRDASFRRLGNETDLLPLLAEHGFEIVSPAGLDVPAQARLFAEAEIVAGPAGAAFANLVFATAPAHAIEIASPQWLAVYHWMISARLGLEHTILLGDGPVMRGIPDISARSCDLHLAEHKFGSLVPPSTTRVFA